MVRARELHPIQLDSDLSFEVDGLPQLCCVLDRVQRIHNVIVAKRIGGA